MNLYTHQQKIIDDDPKKCGLWLGTGSGKTRIALLLARGSTLIIAPKTQVEDQNWIRENESIGHLLPITVISKETFRRYHNTLPRFETVIVDECFIAGTKILTVSGDKNIEDITVGDIVKNAHHSGLVSKVYKNTTDILVTVKSKSGKSFTCTPNHPIFTINRGWVEVAHLSNSDLLMSHDMLLSVYENKQEKTTFLYNLQEADEAWNTSRWAMGSLQKNLFNQMLENQEQSNNHYPYDSVEKRNSKTFISFFSKDEKKQPNEVRSHAEKSISNTQKDSSQAAYNWRQRERICSTSKDFVIRTRCQLAARICSIYKNAFKGLSKLLQNRYSLSKEKNSYRNRWIFSRRYKNTSKGQKETAFSDFERVESITIQKSADSYVYNLSVIGHPSYFANGILVHNCHTTLGATPNTRQRNKQTIPRASQLFEALDTFLTRTKPDRLYLCTATIVKSPMTVWAARKLLGKHSGTIESFYTFRSTFYTKLPMPGREVYAPKRTDECKNALAALVRDCGYTGRLEDYFDVPEQSFKTIHIELSTSQKARIKELRYEYPDMIVRIGKQHQIENGILSGDEFTKSQTFPNGKIEKLLELAEEFPRMVIFAKYRAQIEHIDEVLHKAGYRTALLTGDTQHRGDLIAYANKQTQCIFIAQAQISAGWELPDYPTMVFASRTYSFVDYAQALGRIQRANNIKKNLYINLVVKGGIDEAVDRALANKQDFNEKIYATA